MGAAGLGLIFWTFAARALPAEEVGRGAGLVAAMTLLSTVGVLGVGTFLLEKFKIAPMVDRRPMFTTGLAASVFGGGVLTLAWLMLAQFVDVRGALGDLPATTASVLVMATGLAAACSAFDQAVIGLGASSIQLRRNIIASLIRIAVFGILVGLEVRTGQSILIAWAVGLAGSLLASPVVRHLPRGARMSRQRRWQIVRSNWAVAVSHHGLTLALGTSSLLLPVVVATMMPATQTAYFASARLLSETALGLLYFLTIALFATVKTEHCFRNTARRTLLCGLGLAFALLAGAVVFGRFALMMFGDAYAQSALPLLLLLLAAGPALLVKEHFVVLRRVQGRRVRGAVVMGIWTAVELAGAVIGGLLGGVETLCLGWLLTTSVCGMTLVPGLWVALEVAPAESSQLRGLAQRNETY